MRYKKGQIVKLQGIMAYMDFSGVFEIVDILSVQEALVEEAFMKLWFSNESKDDIIKTLEKDTIYKVEVKEDTHFARKYELVIVPESFIDMTRSYRLPHESETVAIKVCHVTNIDGLIVPQEVAIALREVIEILDDSYEVIRDVDGDLGGYALIINDYELTKPYLKDSYLNLEEDIAEIVERIECSSGEVWLSALMIQMSDYAIQVFMRINQAPENLLNQLES